MLQPVQVLIVAPALAGAIAMTACSAESVSGPAPGDSSDRIASITITPSTDTLVSIGETQQIVATAYDRGGSRLSIQGFTWESSDLAILTVSAGGRVTAVTNGIAIVTARVDGVAGTATLHVRQTAARLTFTTSPSIADAGSPMAPAVEVEIQDALGARVAGATDTIILSLDVNPCFGRLSGSVATVAQQGIGRFADLMIDRPGRGYTLKAAAHGLAPAVTEGFHVAARAGTLPLRLCIVDPAGDNTGQIDVLAMVMGFDPASGRYEIELFASETNPFRDAFRVNINLFNPDVGTTARDPSFFSDAMNDYAHVAATTRLLLQGADPRLSEWAEGHRVFTNSLEGTGNPDGVSLFRSSATNFPMGFLTNEDVIGFARLSKPAVVERLEP